MACFVKQAYSQVFISYTVYNILQSALTVTPQLESSEIDIHNLKHNAGTVARWYFPSDLLAYSYLGIENKMCPELEIFFNM